jgi:hypothetical protein
VILLAETVPGNLDALITTDGLLTAQVFATAAGLALIASAFAFTAASVLENSAAEYRRRGGRRNLDIADKFSGERREVLTGGIRLITAFFFLVAGLGFVLVLDSWGEQAMNSAVHASNYIKAGALASSEIASAGSLLVCGFGALVLGARRLLSAFKSFRDLATEED